VLNNNTSPVQAHRSLHKVAPPVPADTVDNLPGVPVMPETLLMLDLLTQETCVDLRELSNLVLADLGATLQILRLAGSNHGLAPDRPTRIADCISDLNPCLEAVSDSTISRQVDKAEIKSFWEHARSVAIHCRLEAQNVSTIGPEEAYLVGLCHGIGSLPALLGWKECAIADGPLMGLRLAKRWTLPTCITEFHREMQLPGFLGRWSGLVARAHQRVTRTCTDCVFQQPLRPHLHRKGFGHHRVVSSFSSAFNPEEPIIAVG
jgi:HD-like signal output (HDOD) protein